MLHFELRAALRTRSPHIARMGVGAGLLIGLQELSLRAIAKRPRRSLLTAVAALQKTFRFN